MLTYRTGKHAGRGGLDLVISLTPDQYAALGTNAATLAEALDTVLVGLAALRSGHDPRPADQSAPPADTSERPAHRLDTTASADPYAFFGTNARYLAHRLDDILSDLTPAQPPAPHVPPVGRSFKDRPVSAGIAWDEWLIRDASALQTKLRALLSAAIRSHVAHGGSYGDLAAAMGAPRATAQRRRDKVTSAPRSLGELWVTTPANLDDQEASQS